MIQLCDLCGEFQAHIARDLGDGVEAVCEACEAANGYPGKCLARLPWEALDALRMLSESWYRAQLCESRAACVRLRERRHSEDAAYWAELKKAGGR